MELGSRLTFQQQLSPLLECQEFWELQHVLQQYRSDRVRQMGVEQQCVEEIHVQEQSAEQKHVELNSAVRQMDVQQKRAEVMAAV